MFKRGPEKQAEKARAHAKTRVALEEHKQKRTVKLAERCLRDAEEKSALTLAKYSDLGKPSLRVYWDRVRTPEGGHVLTDDLRATVHQAGRDTLVTIEGEMWGYTHDCGPGASKEAHDFVRAFNVLVAAPSSRPAAVMEAASRLAAAQQDSLGLVASREELARLA